MRAPSYLGRIRRRHSAYSDLWLHEFFPIVKEVNIHFHRSALTDVVMEVDISEEEAETLLIEAQEKGKADFSRNLALIDVSGETVAEVKGVWQIRPDLADAFAGYSNARIGRIIKQ